VIKQGLNNSVGECLEGEDKLSLGDIENSLQSYLDRLSESEIVVIKCLANQENPIHNFQQFPETRVSKREIIQSLKRRCLVDTVRIESNNYFQLNLVLKAYIMRNYC